MRLFAACLTALLVAGHTPALAQQVRFDPRTYQTRLHGERTQVLVLATPHLSGTDRTFDPTVLEPLLDRLAVFNPTMIVIEHLSGESISGLLEYDTIYPGTADLFGGQLMLGAALGRAGTKLDMPEAEAEARRLLAEWPAQPTPADRRRLAAVLASSGDLYSALVQWWHLDEAERRAGDGLQTMLADYLNRTGSSRNETNLIGARLAARLGLERLYPTDDQSNADIVQPRIEDLMAFVQQPEMQAIFENPAFQHQNSAAQRLTSAEQVLETYRELNGPEAGLIDSDGQWLSMIDRPSPGHVGRYQVAGWEARNLRQVANIREATAQTPGGRVLVIVGSSHKPWFDAYLSMMSDIEVVDAAAFLR